MHGIYGVMVLNQLIMLVKSKQVSLHKPDTTEMCFKDINNESGKSNNRSTVEA